MNPKQSKQLKQTFVPPNDRPEVKLTPDRPLRDLRVRDLAVILGRQLAMKPELEHVKDKAENRGLMQKCIEKTPPDAPDLRSSPSRGVPRLKQFIEEQCALTEQESKISLSNCKHVF